MKRDRDYYARAGSWATDVRAISARSRRVAWIVAGVAVAIAAFEAVALALLTPLKTVQPITLLVDKQTGFVQALDPLSPKRIVADDALTDSLLAQYVTAREGFDRATVATSYRRVALWSAGRARDTYLAAMPATNTASPFQRYPAGTIVDAAVKSVSRLGPGLALVRFDTAVQGRAGDAQPAQPWVAVVRFRYVDAPMRFADRLVNPLGFQVTGYRRDAEAPPPVAPAIVRASMTVPPPLAGAPTPAGPAPSSERFRPAPAPAPPRRRERTTGALPSQGAALERREVPLNQLPLGSPVSPAGNPIFAAAGKPR